MKNFYLYEEGHPFGPYSIEELHTKNITPNTPVWKEGMPEWLAAGKIEELKSILLTTPPPFITMNPKSTIEADIPSAFMTATERTGFRIGKAMGWTGLVAVLIMIISFVAYKNNEHSSGSRTYLQVERQKTPEELRAELLQSEQQYPGKYINGKTSNWKNLWGKRVIQLQLTNTATLASFKDLVINVTFLSKTGTELGQNQFTVFEYFKPGQVVTHNVRAYAPSATKNVSVTVISATAL